MELIVKSVSSLPKYTNIAEGMYFNKSPVIHSELRENINWYVGHRGDDSRPSLTLNAYLYGILYN
jgi:hypothetical protein